MIATVLSAVLMEMRYNNKRATARHEAEMSSEDFSDEEELKKEK